MEAPDEHRARAGSGRRRGRADGRADPAIPGARRPAQASSARRARALRCEPDHHGGAASNGGENCADQTTGSAVDPELWNCTGSSSVDHRRLVLVVECLTFVTWAPRPRFFEMN